MTEEKKDRDTSQIESASIERAPERWVSVLGFIIVTKADLLAATAFLLSLASIVYQVGSWIRGPAPSVYPPDLIYVFFDKYPNNRTVVRFAAQLAFVNTAEIGRDAIVRDVRLEVTAPGLGINHSWLSLFPFVETA